MEIINAAKPKHHDCSDHQGTDTEVVNPAANFGALNNRYHEEFGFQPLNKVETPPEVPEIRVNGVLIDENSVLAEVQYHPAETKRAAMIKAAEYLIIKELIVQRAKELDFNVIANSLDTAAEYELLEQMMELEAKVPVATEEECQRFYEQNQDKFRTSPLVELRHILIAAMPEDVELRMQTKEIAKQIIEELKACPGDFEKMVSRHSACPSKETKGSLGQISKGQTVPEFEKVIFAAEPGLVTSPIETRYGFHVAFIDRKVEGQALPYEYVQEKVSDYLNEKVTRKNTAQYIQALINDADITGFTFTAESSPLIQ